MNGHFGPLREVSFTVRDIEAEMLDRAFFLDRWHYIEHVNVTDVKYMGVACQDLDISIALASRCEEIWRGVSQLGRFVYFRRQSGSILKMAEITPERTRVLGAMHMDSIRGGSAVIRRGWPK